MNELDLARRTLINRLGSLRILLKRAEECQNVRDETTHKEAIESHESAIAALEQAERWEGIIEAAGKVDKKQSIPWIEEEIAMTEEFIASVPIQTSCWETNRRMLLIIRALFEALPDKKED